MITLRCTKKLLGHLTANADPVSHEASSALGDWCGNLVFMPDGPPYVLVTNERSLLSVIMPHDAEVLLEFRRRVLSLLRRLELPKPAVEREGFHLQQIRLGKTRDRRVLGTVNNAAWQLEVALFKAARRPSLEEIENRLAECPFSLINYRYPVDVARELLGAPPQPRVKPVLPAMSGSSRGTRKKIAAGTRVPVKLDADERALILEHTFSDPEITSPIEAVKPGIGTAELRYTLDDIDELLGSIAAEANHTTDAKLRKKLDRLFARLKGEMESYDDGEWQSQF